MVLLEDLKVVCGRTIKRRRGPEVEKELLPRYVVTDERGRLDRDFRRLTSAEKWCRENPVLCLQKDS
jgi:hypothetical protein